MTSVGLIQTKSYVNNKEGIQNISKLLKNLGNAETEIVCLPEQWLPNNEIKNYDQEFLEFKRMKVMKSQKSSSKSNRYLGSSTEEQFNELLLYVFTGFFLLMIYDNIYKLGRDSFY